MLRTTLAALAISAVLTSVSAAGDCATCGTGYGSGGYAANAWDGYCGCGGGGGACGNACGGGGGCNRCCFPLVHCTLHRVGRVFDALLPDPCCRRSCGTIGCAQPSCGIEPGCGISGPSDPFIDDHHHIAPPQPTPAAEARGRSWSNARMMNHPKPTPALKPRPMKTAAAPMPKAKPVAKSGKSVLKVAYAEEASSDEEYYEDAPPAAPASVRNAAKAPAALAPALRVAAKPVVSANSDSPVNPLRP